MILSCFSFSSVNCIFGYMLLILIPFYFSPKFYTSKFSYNSLLLLAANTISPAKAISECLLNKNKICVESKNVWTKSTKLYNHDTKLYTVQNYSIVMDILSYELDHVYSVIITNFEIIWHCKLAKLASRLYKRILIFNFHLWTYFVFSCTRFGVIVRLHQPVSYTHLDVYKRQA